MPVHILIVDDDKHACRILQTLLLRDAQLLAAEVRVTIAADGEKGLQALEGGAVDLIISDLLMPRMDGFAFCRELRRRPGTEHVPLIVSSAIYKDPITIRKLRVEVGAEFFTKPFQIAEMLGAVRRLLGLQRPTVPPAPELLLPEEGKSGNLGDRPLGQLLLDLYEARATCTLVISHGGLRRWIHLLIGRVVGIESNSRRDALGMFLHGQGALSEEQFTQALQALQERRVRLGQVVLENGWLTEAELLQHMEAQLRQRLRSALRFHEGTFSVSGPSPPYEHITLHGAPPAVVFAALREGARPDELLESYGRATAPLRLTPRAARLRETFEQVFGAGCLADLQQAQPLADLVRAAPHRAARDEVLRRTEALLLCGLATLDPAADFMAAPAAADGTLGAVAALAEGPSHQPEPADARHRELLSEYLSADGRDLYTLLGVAHDAGLGDIQRAYQRACQRLSPERFCDLDLGPDYGKISELRERYRRALSVLSSPMRRADYDRELEAHADMSPQMVEAELLFRHGEALVGAGQLKDALPVLIQAAAMQPDQADYHALLGWTRFLSARHAGTTAQAAAQQALSAVQQALEIDPDHPDAHAYAGHVAAALQRDIEAAHHFEQVLRVQPTRRDALVGLEVALRRLQQLPRLERRYRQILHRIADSGPRSLLLDLLHRLFTLVEERGAVPATVKDETSQAVLELWTALLPDEPVPADWLSRLASRPIAPDRAADQTAELRAAWRQQPDNGEIGRALFRRLLPQPDRAFLCAAVLSRRGQADEEATLLYQKNRPRHLLRAQVPPGVQLLELVRHPEDSPEIETVMEQLLLCGTLSHEPAMEAPRLTLERVAPAAVPVDVGRVMSYVAQVTQLSWPPLYSARVQDSKDLPDQGGLFIASSPGQGPGQAGPSGLVLSQDLLACADRVRLCFVIGRLSASLRPGRFWAAGVPPARMQTLLRGSGPKLDLARLRLGQVRTADRLGLLLCNDVETAARELGARAQRDPDAEADLLDFALTPAYQAARDQLGLSLHV